MLRKKSCSTFSSHRTDGMKVDFYESIKLKGRERERKMPEKEKREVEIMSIRMMASLSLFPFLL